jgi:hypothetical protein
MKRRKQMRVRFFSLDYLIFADNYREEEDEMIQRGEMEMMDRLSVSELYKKYVSELALND